jgi:hypothetical protein
MGKMAKMNVAVSGGSEYDLLDCVPLTEYVNNVATKISPDHILAEVQEHFKQVSKDRLPSAPLETALSSLNIDLSAWYNVDTKKFKKSAPKASVTEHNGSKVKIKVSIDPSTNKPRTKDEINKLEQIANVIQTVMVEAKWVAYSIDNYNYFDVLRNIALEKMFPDEIEMVIETIESCNSIKEMVIKNFNDKKIAYAGLDPKDVYDDVFMNNEYKQSIGLVYVNFELAKEMVDNLPNKYNRKDAIILVINALSGTIPILLRERFPKARIICAEYFDYFTDHLTRLGFEVTKIIEKKGELVLDKKYDGIKADVVIGNPPYQDGDRKDQANKLWPQFVKKADGSIKNNGYVILITPNSWMQPTADIGKGSNENSLNIFNDIFKKNNLIQANIDSDSIRDKYFKGVGSTFSQYTYQKSPYSGNTEFVTPAGNIKIDITKIDSLPKLTSKESLSIVKKMRGSPFVFCDQNHGLNGVEGPNKGIIIKNKKVKGSVKSTEYDLKHTIYHTNKNNGTYWFGEKLNPYSAKSKVIISLSGTYSPVFNNKTGFSNMCIALICDTDVEALNAQTILCSKLYRFWVEMQKFSGFNPRKLLLNLPKVDLNRSWNDVELYQHFGLTQEEIDYIESTIK